MELAAKVSAGDIRVIRTSAVARREPPLALKGSRWAVSPRLCADLYHQHIFLPILKCQRRQTVAIGQTLVVDT